MPNPSRKLSKYFEISLDTVAASGNIYVVRRFREKGKTMAYMNYDETLNAMWDEQENYWGVSEEVLQVVTDINGYNHEAMRDILYATNGERTFKFEENEDEDEDEE